MANLSTLQEHIDTLKQGTPEQKNQKLTPESIADVRKFITEERLSRSNGTNYSLEGQFHEWEDLVKRFEEEKGIIRVTTATSTAAAAVDVATTPTATTTQAKTPGILVDDIEKELSAIEENNFASFKSAIEKLLFLVSEFEAIQPQHREAVRGSLGVMILERLAKADYRVTLSGQNIEVKSDRNPSGAAQIRAFLQGQSGMNEILAYGLVYRSSEFKKYSEVYLSEDKKSVKGVPEDYFDYTRSARRGQSGRSLSPNDQDLERSRSTVATILRDPNTLKGLIIGVPFLEESLRTVAGNPQLQSAVAAAATQAVASTPQTPTSTPSSSGSGSSGQLPDWDKDPINRTLAEIGQGFTGGLNKMMNTPGAFGGLIIATIATMIFGGFKKGLMVLAGGVGLSAVVNRAEANGFMPGNNPATPTSAPAPAAAAGAANAPAAGPTSTIDTSKLSPQQKKGVDKILANNQIKDMITSHVATQNTTKGIEIATLDKYLAFIHSDTFQNRKAKDLIDPSGFVMSIFSSEKDFDKGNDNSMNSTLLKKILRIYLTGSMDVSAPATGTNKKRGEKEKDDFIGAHQALFNNQNLTFKELVNEIHK